METGLFTNSQNRIPGISYKPKTVSGEEISAEASEKGKDSFEKAIDDELSKNWYEDYQKRLKQRKKEIQQEQQQAIELRAERRRKLKLLLKKHEDYVRFLEGTALKKALAERERIQNPHASAAEINESLPMSPGEAKMPLFIRVH